MIIDSFLFNGEFDLLEGRMEYLHDIVDYFIIVEADTTFSGNEKELVFSKNLKRYKKYSDKILYFPYHVDCSNFNLDTIVDDFDPNSVPWKIEEQIRNYIMVSLKLFNGNDYFMYSDVDEIPSKFGIKTAMHHLNKDMPVLYFKQDLFYYNLQYKDQEPWFGSFMTTVDYVLTKIDIETLRKDRWNVKFVYDGGWHLSYWMTPEEIVNKIKSFSHQELNKDCYLDIDHIKSCINSGMDLFQYNRTKFFEPYQKENFPSDFYNIFSKYVKKSIQHYYQNVYGAFTKEDGKLYKAVVKHFNSPAHFVEIGSFAGRSSSLMSVEIMNSGKNIQFDCIDTWEGSEEQQNDPLVINNQLYNSFIENMKPVEGYYNPIKTTSLNAAKLYKNNSLDFVFIDAAHDYESVKSDIENWFPKMKSTGIISGHDYPFPPVRRAVNEFFNNIRIVGDCWYIFLNDLKI